MRLILPILLALVGLAAGIGAGHLLRPVPEPVIAAATETPPPSPMRPANTEVLRMPNQFLIPLIGEGRVRAMVVLGIALELLPGHGIELQAHEARLRSIFLQLLFDHANTGGFDGVFTGGEQLLGLRRILRDAARSEFGAVVHDVLIVDLLRQEN